MKKKIIISTIVVFVLILSVFLILSLSRKPLKLIDELDGLKKDNIKSVSYARGYSTEHQILNWNETDDLENINKVWRLLNSYSRRTNSNNISVGGWYMLSIELFDGEKIVIGLELYSSIFKTVIGFSVGTGKDRKAYTMCSQKEFIECFSNSNNSAYSFRDNKHVIYEINEDKISSIKDLKKLDELVLKGNDFIESFNKITFKKVDNNYNYLDAKYIICDSYFEIIYIIDEKTIYISNSYFDLDSNLKERETTDKYNGYYQIIGDADFSILFK